MKIEERMILFLIAIAVVVAGVVIVLERRQITDPAQNPAVQFPVNGPDTPGERKAEQQKNQNY